MEPNISFQKTSVVPIMAMERWFRKHPEWTGEICVYNGERLLGTPFFKESILPTLELHKKGRIQFYGRKDIVSIMREYPSATFILHQWNNEYNYMLFELFWAGFPVIHNASSSWGCFGYSYIQENHKNNVEIYKGHARQLAWRHSPYNPKVQEEWLNILTNK
jgi:hypothetical protein